MTKVVNLRQARKRKRRTEKETAAAANRLRHGSSAVTEEQGKLARALDERRLDAHRREPRTDADKER